MPLNQSSPEFWMSRRKLAGDHPEQGMWLKYIDPDELEGEHYQVYTDTLTRIKAQGISE